MMGRFTLTLLRLIKNGFNNRLRTQDTIATLEIAPDYPILKWVNDRGVEVDTRRAFLTVATAAPYIADEEVALKEQTLIREFSIADNPCKGLGFAFLFEGVAVSMSAEHPWDTHELVIRAVLY